MVSITAVQVSPAVRGDGRSRLAHLRSLGANVAATDTWAERWRRSLQFSVCGLQSKTCDTDRNGLQAACWSWCKLKLSDAIRLAARDMQLTALPDGLTSLVRILATIDPIIERCALMKPFIGSVIIIANIIAATLAQV